MVNYSVVCNHQVVMATDNRILAIYANNEQCTRSYILYRIRGLFGSDFNLAVWQIFIGLPNLNHVILTRTHEMN